MVNLCILTMDFLKVCNTWISTRDFLWIFLGGKHVNFHHGFLVGVKHVNFHKEFLGFFVGNKHVISHQVFFKVLSMWISTEFPLGFPTISVDPGMDPWVCAVLPLGCVMLSVSVFVHRTGTADHTWDGKLAHSTYTFQPRDLDGRHGVSPIL